MAGGWGMIAGVGCPRPGSVGKGDVVDGGRLVRVVIAVGGNAMTAADGTAHPHDQQATIGLLILNALDRALAARNLPARTAVVVSRTEVAAEDPAFSAPSKPIGR